MLSVEATPFVPGNVRPLGLLSVGQCLPKTEPIGWVGEVNSGSSCTDSRSDPSPVLASAGANTIVVSNPQVIFQDIDNAPPFVSSISDSDSDLNKSSECSSTLTSGYDELDHGFTQHQNSLADDLVDTSSDAASVSYISPLGTVVNVFPECRSGLCDCQYFIGEIKSQLKPCRFASLINDILGESACNYENLLWGVTDGFPIVDQVVEPYECSNYNSILDPVSKAKMDFIVNNELREGMISVVESKPKCVHALGAVPKASGGIRPITDCSRPLGKSVNNYCDSLLEEFCFKSVENVVEMLDPGEYMSVIDIKSAYRAVPIKLEHRTLQGFSWVLDGVQQWFEDNRMCFGLRLGPSYFNLISNFVYEALSSKYGIRVVNYLDDFITIGSSYDDCRAAQEAVIGMLRFLGFHVSFNKLICPSTCVTYLGVIIDSVRMELRLPEGKLVKLINLIDSQLSKKRVSKKDLESLGGLLSHCAHIVKGGKIFCKSIYELYKTLVRRNAKFIKVPDNVTDDLLWWKRLCRYFNGSSKICRESFPWPLVSDSSFKGFGAYLGEDWVAGVWHDEDCIALASTCNHVAFRPTYDLLSYDNINELELWPIVVGLKRWALLFKNCTVTVFTDNTQVMYMLLNGGSSNEVCKKWIKEIFWLCAIYNINLLPKYINTKANLVADTLSRLPYFDSYMKLEECLLGSNLCCLNDLFQIFRDKI